MAEQPSERDNHRRKREVPQRPDRASTWRIVSRRKKGRTTSQLPASQQAETTGRRNSEGNGEIIVFADNDVFWPPYVLTYMLAGFETNESIGTVGGFHRACRQNTPAAAEFNGWEALAARKLWLRKVDVSASFRLDGGIPCISGRTAAYRATIVKDVKFQDCFTNKC
jgi:cellulose synthase/poly-beta-1,6-N-acetylglucosamine synthase-like glycosyltransferase